MPSPHSAAAAQERHLALARSASDGPEVARACRELVLVYRSHAEALEASRDLGEAAKYHERCLQVRRSVRATCPTSLTPPPQLPLPLPLPGPQATREAEDRVAEGLANYRLGRCHVLLSQAREALPFLEEYVSEGGEGSGGGSLRCIPTC